MTVYTCTLYSISVAHSVFGFPISVSHPLPRFHPTRRDQIVLMMYPLAGCGVEPDSDASRMSAAPLFIASTCLSNLSLDPHCHTSPTCCLYQIPQCCHKVHPGMQRMYFISSYELQYVFSLHRVNMGMCTLPSLFQGITGVYMYVHKRKEVLIRYAIFSTYAQFLL